MRLGTGLFVAFITIFALCFWYPVTHIAQQLRAAYLESAEEPLVDEANIFAATIGHDMEKSGFDAEALSAVFADVYARSLSAQIYGLRKQSVDARIYITDAAGLVIFDSKNPGSVGADYSRWRDVYLTLRGQYGARVARIAGGEASELFVAAPIFVRGELAGVLTVVKPTTNIELLSASVQPRLIQIGAVSLAVAVLLSLLVSLWLAQQLGRLTRYAYDVRDGRRVPLPRLAATELRTMGNAFEKMRESLAGHVYVEHYVQTLTHEIKSPLSAIRGAAEILQDPELAPEQRARFLRNLDTESRRIQDLIERMLKLSELEARRGLPADERVGLGPIARTISQSSPVIPVTVDIPDDLFVRGDPFLLHLALSNLVQNAIDFSPRGASVSVTGLREGTNVVLRVADAGPGIPEFAKERVFEKFFSLERPETGKKSTGLGLNFVKEIAALHHGSVRLDNRRLDIHGEGGLWAILTLPAAPLMNESRFGTWPV